MTPTIILGAIVAVPLALLMILRINAALVFLSLCLGDVLVQFVADDANSFISLLQSTHATQATDTVATGSNFIRLVLLLLPVLLTAIFMIKTVKGAKLLLNILPAAGVGLLGGLLVVPLLSPGLSTNIIQSSLWLQVTKAQNLIVGSSAMVCLLVLWLQRPKAGGGSEKHSKHHG
ncbi:MAG: hypothetical protein QFB87_01325 [Patescibacteria group bacterium]|nr:hypothetical protein [Patescibacteria group bacterium]